MRWNNIWFGDREDVTAAASALSRLLPHHFPCEIPNEEEDVVRLVRRQPIRMSNRDALTGHVLALFEGVSVGDEFEEPLTEIEIVHQR